MKGLSFGTRFFINSNRFEFFPSLAVLQIAGLPVTSLTAQWGPFGFEIFVIRND